MINYKVFLPEKMALGAGSVFHDFYRTNVCDAKRLYVVFPYDSSSIDTCCIQICFFCAVEAKVLL